MFYKTLFVTVLIIFSLAILFWTFWRIKKNLPHFQKAKTEKVERKVSMKNVFKYEVQEHLKPNKLNGISDTQISDHWNLYKGYVAQVNKLNEELIELAKNDMANSLTYADRRRRYGFEYNGMVLHEYYFGNLTSKISDLLDVPLKKAIINTWGFYESWLKDFINTGKTRSIGWTILYADPRTGQLINTFIQEHEIGHIAGFIPIIVMDVWEHAYMVDHKAGGRLDYIEAFIKNINWQECEKRYQDAKERKITKRF